MEYPITLEIEYPEKLSRLRTFFRYIMAIPQLVALSFIGIAAWFILSLSWWAILFTAKYPEVFFNFIFWYYRWAARLTGYLFLLTDKYPPFSGRA